MTFPSNKHVSTTLSYPSSLSSFRAYKHFRRAKLWRSRNDSTKRTISVVHNSASVRPNLPQFFKYLKQDVKTGKVKADTTPAISHRAEGGVINSSSISLISEELGATVIPLKSRDFTSPYVYCLPRSLPKRLLSSHILTWTQQSIQQSILLPDVSLPPWPQHYSQVFELFSSSSFHKKGCVCVKNERIQPHKY